MCRLCCCAALAEAEEETRTIVGDVGGNKKVDSTDARITLQYAVGRIQNVPVEE